MRGILFFAAGLALLGGMTPSRGQDATSKPNIILILADDLGWRDLGCYGSYSYETPHIDELAREGMRFTEAYAQPSCSPTRSSILTGMDCARIGITGPVCHVDQVKLTNTYPPKTAKWLPLITADSVTRLDTKYITYAKLLQTAGYVTGHFGKWHLGKEPYSPLQQGFDVDVPHYWGPGPEAAPGGYSYLAPWGKDIVKGLKLPWKPGDQLEDHMALEASAFIDQNKDKPFLMDYWAFSVHSALNAKPEYVAGYQNLDDPEAPNAHALQRNPVYAGMVKSLDDGVGTLMDTLRRDGLLDKTIVIFMSDNGGLEYWDGGGMEHKNYQGVPATNNAPLRMGKGSIYEGGVRVPLIVRWPGVVQPGSVTHAKMVCMDLYPTILQMAGLTPPTTQPLDGVSQVPVLNGSAPEVRKKVFCVVPCYAWNYAPDILPPRASIHDGDWKLIRLYGANADGSDRLELYNLHDDIGETFDMSAALPDLTQKLAKKLDDYIAEIHPAMPMPNSNFDPKVNYPSKLEARRKPSEPLNLPPDGD